MKKIFTSILVSIAIIYAGQGQPVFVQDFENGIEPMKLYDVDGQTAHQNVAFWADAWTVANPAFGNETNVAVSNSWYTPPGTADDWMVTPQIPIQEGTFLTWDAKAQDGSFRDGYQVRLSTTGDMIEDFTEVVFETSAEVADWTTRIVDLTPYAGQDVHIAFRNNSNDKFLLVVDNIIVYQPRENDIRIQRLSPENVNRGTTLEGPRNLDFTIVNMGTNNVNSIVASYIVNDGDTVTSTIDGLNLVPGGSVTLSHPEVLTLMPGDENIQLLTQTVNNDVDLDLTTAFISDLKVFPPIPDFDLVSSKGENIKLYDVLSSQKAVVLDFFASWCGPCASSTPALNQFYVDNGSGGQNLDVFGMNIEPSDDDNVVNNLGWGATYPKFSYSETMEDFWTHFDRNHGLGSGSIPFFVLICPNSEDPGHSEIIHSEIGFSFGLFTSDFQPPLDECIAGLTTSVEEIGALKESRIYPNPATDQLNIEFGLEATSEIHIQIIDQLGRMVQDLGIQTFLDGNNKVQIETSDFDNGIYYVRMNRSREISTFKFTVAQ